MSTPRKNHAHGINLAVARALTQARKDAGFTHESLAAKLDGMSLTSLQRYLSGKSAIDVEALSKICAIVGVSEVDILRRASEAGPEQQEVDAAVSRLDDAIRRTRPARTKDEMQRMDQAAARHGKQK